jgi:hypothetical protein
VVNSLNNDGVSFGQPPYYVMALEVGGIPTVDPVGEDRTSLNWVVRHAAGEPTFFLMRFCPCVHFL